MTEEDIRRIVREEVERAKEPPSYRGIPMPVVPTYYVPLPSQYYPWTSSSPWRVT